MGSTSIERALDAAESAVAGARGLGGTGFWAAVAEVKQDPALVREYADRIAVIDQAAFDNWALVKVPLVLGTTLATLVTIVGLAVVTWANSRNDLVGVLVFGIGVVALLGATHGLGHLLVGRVVGIRFTRWFVAEVTRPQPGVKVDYASYLRATPRRRAWMHAAGAIVTKTIPFALVPLAWTGALPGWVPWALIVAGVAMILTDLLWSTKASDWAKFGREMRFAQDS